MNLFYRRSHSRLSIFSLLLLFLLWVEAGFAQTVLNGDFENNTSVGNQINLSHAAYNAQMANSFSFGSYGDMDIITNAMYCGLAQHGLWYVAFTGGGTDAISLTLSAPLVPGNTYTLSFWDRGCTSWTPYPYEFGLSTVNNAFGTVIYIEPSAPVLTVWTQHTFTFTAPNNGQYITIQMTAGSTGDWAHMDNVEFVNAGPPSSSHFQASDSVLCQNDCISFTDLSTNNPTSWKWTFTGAYPPTSTEQYPPLVCYPNGGTYPVTLHASNAVGGDTLTITNYILVSAAPPTPTIVQYQDTLVFTRDPSYVAYQWFDSTAIIPGATDTFLVVTHGGNYNVQVSNASNCKIAVGINVVLGIRSYNQNIFSLYPMPVGHQLTICGLRFQGVPANVNIYNIMGKQVFVKQSLLENPKSEISIDVSILSAGIYFLQLNSESETVTRKFIKE